MSNSKSGLFFCSREHKDLAQRIGGIKEIQPDHYGEGKYSKYRTKALRFLEQVCNRCGYQEHPEILQAHHIDHNRSNNDIKNLEMLCPNCHALEHRN
jgi:5-methylcytosine-specific restriction endonuclease McrA